MDSRTYRGFRCIPFIQSNLSREKNFIENLDKIKTLLNLWSWRGFSLYSKVTVIKSLVILKFVYICSLIPVADEFVKELYQLVYKFLWNGRDKATCLTTINDYAKGGLKMIDLDCMIKSFHLTWLQRIYNITEGPWKWYLFYLLTKLMTSRFLHYSILNFWNVLLYKYIYVYRIQVNWSLEPTVHLCPRRITNGFTVRTSVKWN